jgi:hypothetical protein
MGGYVGNLKARGRQSLFCQCSIYNFVISVAGMVSRVLSKIVAREVWRHALRRNFLKFGSLK